MNVSFAASGDHLKIIIFPAATIWFFEYLKIRFVLLQRLGTGYKLYSNVSTGPNKYFIYVTWVNCYSNKRYCSNRWSRRLCVILGLKIDLMVIWFFHNWLHYYKNQPQLRHNGVAGAGVEKNSRACPGRGPDRSKPYIRFNYVHVNVYAVWHRFGWDCRTYISRMWTVYEWKIGVYRISGNYPVSGGFPAIRYPAPFLKIFNNTSNKKLILQTNFLVSLN